MVPNDKISAFSDPALSVVQAHSLSDYRRGRRLSDPLLRPRAHWPGQPTARGQLVFPTSLPPPFSFPFPTWLLLSVISVALVGCGS